MPAFLLQLVNSIKAVWAKMSVVQRVALMGGLVLVGSAAIGLSIWASRPDYKLLYSNQPAEGGSGLTNIVFSFDLALVSWYWGRR